MAHHRQYHIKAKILTKPLKKVVVRKFISTKKIKGGTKFCDIWKRNIPEINEKNMFIKVTAK